MLNYHILKTAIVLNYDGQTVTVHANDSRYDDVIEAIKAEDYDSIPDLVDVEKRMAKAGMQYKDGLLYLNNIPMPEDLNDRIEHFVATGLPTEYLVKFWDKLKQNPSFRARKMLFKFLENNGHPITPEGNFIAYRGVTNDFKDCHTRTFDNSPGSVCEMPRHLVDDDPNHTCSSGLHVACHSYANGFGPKMIEVEVNPVDVVCVPNDYDGTKMRVCGFKVVRECEQILDDGVYDDECEYCATGGFCNICVDDIPF